MQNYSLYLDYLELRRRIEKRLSRSRWLMLHAALFVISVTVWVTYITQENNLYNYIYGVYFTYYPPETLVMTGWSILLLLHGLRTFMRSGASADRRESLIENEMRERLEKNDSYLTYNPRNLFRLHGLLDEDIRKRASLVPVLLAFIICNAAGWTFWAITAFFHISGDDAVRYPWQATPLLGAFFIALLALSAFRRTRHNRRMRDLIPSALESATEQPDMGDDDYLTRLSDDGELVDYPFEAFKMKRKNG